jgi:hypothetical protein
MEDAERKEPESSLTTDPLIHALVDKLPPPSSIWSINDRANWLKALAMIFNVVYRTEKSEAKEQKQKTEKAESTLTVLSAVSWSKVNRSAKVNCSVAIFATASFSSHKATVLGSYAFLSQPREEDGLVFYRAKLEAVQP